MLILSMVMYVPYFLVFYFNVISMAMSSCISRLERLLDSYMIPGIKPARKFFLAISKQTSCLTFFFFNLNNSQ